MFTYLYLFYQQSTSRQRANYDIRTLPLHSMPTGYNSKWRICELQAKAFALYLMFLMLRSAERGRTEQANREGISGRRFAQKLSGLEIIALCLRRWKSQRPEKCCFKIILKLETEGVAFFVEFLLGSRTVTNDPSRNSDHLPLQ